jgi:hypothetical protein
VPIKKEFVMAIAKIKFNVPVQIKNALGRRETFKPGTYDFDDKVVDHWFIQGLIACGKAVILEQAVKSEPAKPKQQELPFTAPAAKPVAVKKEEPIKPVVVDLGAEGKVEVEEIKPSAPKKKIEVGESIAAPKQEDKKTVLRKKKRSK